MRDDLLVRTTLDIDDDLLQAAKELAVARGRTAGQVVSDLLRRALAGRPSTRIRNGVPLVPRRPADARRPTMALVNQLRDD